MVCNIVKHVSHCATRCHSVDSNLLLTGVLGHDSHKRVNGSLGARVDGVVGNTEVLGCVGGSQDNTTTLIEVAVCLTGNEELPTGVKAKYTVKFFLYATRIMISNRIFLIHSNPKITYLSHVSEVSKADNAGVADNNVESTKVSNGIVHKLGSLWNIPDVGLEGNSISSKGLDFIDDFVCRLFGIGIVDNNFRSTAAELSSNSCADPSSRTGNECDFAVEAVRDVWSRHFELCRGVGFKQEGSEVMKLCQVVLSVSLPGC